MSFLENVVWVIKFIFCPDAIYKEKKRDIDDFYHHDHVYVERPKQKSNYHYVVMPTKKKTKERHGKLSRSKYYEIYWKRRQNL